MPTAVSFRMSTYIKRPKGETGVTQMSSQRISLSEALDWLLNELPEDSVTLTHSEDGERVQVCIDWAKVPEHIRRPQIRRS